MSYSLCKLRHYFNTANQIRHEAVTSQWYQWQSSVQFVCQIIRVGYFSLWLRAVSKQTAQIDKRKLSWWESDQQEVSETKAQCFLHITATTRLSFLTHSHQMHMASQDQSTYTTRLAAPLASNPPIDFFFFLFINSTKVSSMKWLWSIQSGVQDQTKFLSENAVSVLLTSRLMLHAVRVYFRFFFMLA